VIEAANDGDWAVFAAAFAADGVLDGWGRHLRSRDEIACWLASDDNEVPAPLSVRGWFWYGEVATVGVEVASGEGKGALTFAFELAGERVRGLRVSG
jgi:hypothetical protein